MSSNPQWKQHWPEFQRLMESRLQQGFQEYGDGSFSLPPERLLQEIEEEMLDIVGWAFILWVRIKNLRDLAQV